MKKIMAMGIAALMAGVLAMPAGALENKFGGYWRTRFFTQQNFAGHEDSTTDLSRVDTRTRLYYTAKINDSLKFVNKFEMDAVWGVGGKSYGDVGADGVAVEVKNSYADFSLSPMLKGKVGVQGYKLARGGLLLNDDLAGAVVTFNSDMATVPLVWFKAYEGGIGHETNSDDFDYYAVAPVFTPSEIVAIKPYVLYTTSDDYAFGGDGDGDGIQDFGDADIFYAGLDLDLKMDVASLWFTGIYQFGEMKPVIEAADESRDISAWLLGCGASAHFGPVGVHGQVIYATGQDETSDDLEAFVAPKGQSYYWSEIMGYGVFDNQASANSPHKRITNILMGNLGATFKPMDDLSIRLDLWHAQLAEDNGGEDELGTEVDIKATYKLVEGLNLDLIAAYLFAGDATYKGEKEENPVEIGTRLSLKF